MKRRTHIINFSPKHRISPAIREQPQDETGQPMLGIRHSQKKAPRTPLAQRYRPWTIPYLIKSKDSGN